MKKNEYRKYFFAAVGVAIVVFVCVGAIMLNYSITVRRELYETVRRILMKCIHRSVKNSCR